MQYEDIDSYYAYEQTQICRCGASHSIWTSQSTIYCEYTHEVYIKCPMCGDFMGFEVSVN